MFWADWWADFRDDAFGEAANHFFFFGADLALSLSSMMVLATARATATAPHGFAPCFAGDPSNRRHVRFGQIGQTDSMGVTVRGVACLSVIAHAQGVYACCAWSRRGVFVRADTPAFVIARKRRFNAQWIAVVAGNLKHASPRVEGEQYFRVDRRLGLKVSGQRPGGGPPGSRGVGGAFPRVTPRIGAVQPLPRAAIIHVHANTPQLDSNNESRRCTMPIRYRAHLLASRCRTMPL